ncbi:MAG: DUF1616 domain-containing protein [Candidatus Altiarchaeota archaeon]
MEPHISHYRCLLEMNSYGISGSSRKKIIGLSIFSILIVSGFFYFYAKINPLTTIRSIILLMCVFFLPGFAVSWALFIGNKELSTADRLSLSFGLSILLVITGMLFAHHIFRIEYTSEGAALVIGALVVLPIIWRIIWRVIEYAFGRMPEKN